jgi:uncharacterized protein YndB with AHSA1/START domain
MKQIPSSTDILVVYGDFHGFTPEELFDYWVEPELITQWWPKVAEVDPGIGGNYRFTWPEQQWFLHGVYAEFERGKRLKFGWTWNHEPGIYEPLWVDIHFMEIDHGTRMSIFHGPYTDSESDQGARQGNLEGWIHFGSRLAGLRVGESE